MKKRWVSLCMALLISFLFVTSAYADNLADKKDKLDDVQDRIEDIKEKIDDVKDEKKDVLGDINKITSDMDKLQDEINTMTKQVSQVKNEITLTNKELDQAQKDYDKEKNLYEQRVKAMYMNGPSGYLEILLTSQSFSDLISNADIMQRVIEYDKKILLKMKEKQAEIQEKKESLEKKQKELSTLQTGLAEKKKKLAAQNAEKQQYYGKLKKDEAALERALDEEMEESKRIQDEIREIQRQLQNSSNQGSYSGSKTGILRLSDIGYMPRISSKYGWRFHPVLKKDKFHAGIDIAIPSGTPVYSMAEGQVIISKYSSSYGNYIVVNHGGGVTSLYAHLSSRLVSAGETVTKGQLIAKSGNTGRSTGPHLHFEVSINGSTVDPEKGYYIVGQ